VAKFTIILLEIPFSPTKIFLIPEEFKSIPNSIKSSIKVYNPVRDVKSAESNLFNTACYFSGEMLSIVPYKVVIASNWLSLCKDDKEELLNISL